MEQEGVDARDGPTCAEAAGSPTPVHLQLDSTSLGAFENGEAAEREV